MTAAVIDLDVPQAPRPAPTQPAGAAWWPVLAGLVVVLVMLTLTAAARGEAPVDEHAVGLSHSGPAIVEYAAVWSDNSERRAEIGPPVTYLDPTAVILTIRAEPGKHAGCAIEIDGQPVDAEISARGGVATCAWVRPPR